MDLNSCYDELGFAEPPFSLTPDTDFFFPGSHHLKALKHLQFALASGGFTLLTGEVGLGKTLLCRQLLRGAPVGIKTAYIFNPQQSLTDLLNSIHYDLTGEALDGMSDGQMHRAIYDALLKMGEEGKKAAVLVDEAHRLTPELLEGLRLLSNLDTEKEKLMYLLLVGQPELDRTLSTKEMRPLAQRISVRYHLKPFNFRETRSYVRHRLQTARKPSKREPLFFNSRALFVLHRLSKGVPRRINQICDRAVLAAFASGQRRIGSRIVMRAAREFK